MAAASMSPSTNTEQLIEQVEHQMHKYYPGNYTVEEFYDTNRMVMSYRLKFNDDTEKTMWLLKYS